jgi:hypothetical protein
MADDTTSLKLLLAEDHVLVRDGLKRLINDQADMEVIAEAEDGVQAPSPGAGPYAGCRPCRRIDARTAAGSR